MPRLMQRATAIAALIALPSILAAGALTAIEVYARIRPEAPLFPGPLPGSLAEAIAGGFSVEQAYAFIRAGQDVNEPMAVDNPQDTAGETVRVSPLMLAVAVRDSNITQMLLNFGARIDLPQNRLAGCLAGEIRDPGIETVIAAAWAHVGIAPMCLGRRQEARTPLLAWSQ